MSGGLRQCAGPSVLWLKRWEGGTPSRTELCAVRLMAYWGDWALKSGCDEDRE